MKNQQLTIHPVTSEEFAARRTRAVKSMTLLACAYLDDVEDFSDAASVEARESLTRLLTAWWDERNMCLEDIDPTSPLIARRIVAT